MKPTNDLASWLWLFALVATSAPAQTFDFPTPSDDRWQYPFNFSGGARPTGSCFSSLGTGVPEFDNFNDRDGVVIVAWNTSSQIPPGQGAATRSITLRLPQMSRTKLRACKSATSHGSSPWKKSRG